MGYEEDFVKEDKITLKVKGYPEGSWEFKPTTAGQENDWLNDYMVFDEETKKMKQDFGKLNHLKMLNLVKVPYDHELIKKMIGQDKEWEKLSNEQKLSLINKLSPNVFDKILDAINIFQNGDNSVKKD